MHRDREPESWKIANPFVLVNVCVIGQVCGRAASPDEARRRIEERGDTFIGVEGRSVLFARPCRC